MEVFNAGELIDKASPPPERKTGWPWTEDTSPDIYDKNIAWPKISIVTPSFNQGQFIEETIRSVLLQNYPNIEYMIIDGGSTDNTIEIIKKYEKQLAYWVSEPDKGQAHAINKGLEKASGEIFQWINSDDYLEQGALFKIAEAFKNPKIDAVAGKTVYFKDGVFEEPIQQSMLSAKGLIKWGKGVKFVQPGVWLRREKILDCGGIDEKFHCAFDWDLLIRYLCKFNQIKYIDDILVYFRLHDQSKTVSLLEKFGSEEEQIIKKLIQIPEFKQVHKIGKFRIQRTEWYGILDQMSKEQKSKTIKIRNILKTSFELPSVRLNRITLGAIKNIIFNK